MAQRPVYCHKQQQVLTRTGGRNGQQLPPRQQGSGRLPLDGGGIREPRLH